MVDCRYQGEESACIRCCDCCHRIRKSKDADCCDSEGVDNLDCKHHSCHSNRCPWRVLSMMLAETLKGRTNHCTGPEDYLKDTLLLGFSDSRLESASQLSGGRHMDSQPWVSSVPKGRTGGIAACSACLQCRAPPEPPYPEGQTDALSASEHCIAETTVQPEGDGFHGVGCQRYDPKDIEKSSSYSCETSQTRPTIDVCMRCKRLRNFTEVNKCQCSNSDVESYKGWDEYCKEMVNKVREAMNSESTDLVGPCEVRKGEVESFKGCIPCRWCKVPHDILTDCRTDTCLSHEVYTTVTPTELEHTNKSLIGDCTEVPAGECQSPLTQSEVQNKQQSENVSEKVTLEREKTEPDIHGRVLHTNQQDVEVEIPGRIKTAFDGKYTPEIMWLVDTGATKSIISSRTYHRCLAGCPVEKAGIRMTAINGSDVRVLGKCTLTIEFNGKEYEHTFVIAGVQEEGILGKDFLRANRCYWNWEQNTLEIDGQEIKCRVPLIKDIPAADVKALKSYTIPAQTEMIIEGVVVGTEKTLTTGMVTGTSKFMKKRQLGVAATLTKRCGGIVPVRVMNPSNRKRFVGIHDNIATYQAVEILEHTEKEDCRMAKVTDEGQWTVELEDLYNRCQEGLSAAEADKLRKLLQEYSEIFAAEGKPLGRTNLVQHEIHTGNHGPIKQRPRRAPLGQEDVIQKELDKMLKQGVISASHSAWASPVVLVKKKDGSVRFCIDYRQLNDITEKDAYPLPRVDDNLDALSGAKLFSTLDLASGYWQVGVDPKDQEKTAFCTRYGLYQWRVMPFGLCNAPSTFERLMERVLDGLQWKVALLYLDDVIVFSSDMEQHMERLRLVFDRIRGANLQLKPKKCHLFQEEVSFLGHRVSAKGVMTEEDKTKAVIEWPTPKTVKGVRSFLGLTGYYRRFVKNYADIAAPLIALTEKSASFIWGEKEQMAFDDLKTKLTTAPILGYPSRHEKFVLDTDASKCSIGAVLSQVQNGKEVVIAYGSRRMSKSERNYCVTRQELLAIVWFTEHFKHYLIGHKFLLRTDHGSLRWLFGFKEPEGQMARWLERLARFDFDIEHRAGSKHGNSDGLSRIPCEGNCKTCMRGHEMSEGKPESIRVVRTSTRRQRGRTQRARRTVGPPPTQNSWMEEIQKWQAEDPDLKIVGTWTERPTWAEIVRERPEIKYYWSRWAQLQQRDGIWYYKWNESKDSIWKIIVPPAGQAEILREHHDDPMAGHFGIEKTLKRLRKSPYFWPKLRATVEKWCRECQLCARTKHVNLKARAPMKTVGAGSTLERVGIDILGPLTETENGNRFILVVGDYWTKWMEAYPLPDHTAETVASTLVHQFFARFGLPDQVHSDQGREFEGKLFQEMCRLLRIDKTRTTPWRPCSNGLVENFNKTLGTMLRQLSSDHQRDWDQYVELATMAYRSTVHDSTGQTPNKMMLGRELPMPSYLLVETPEQKGQERTQPGRYDFVEALQNKILEAHAVAREQLKKSHVNQKKQYDRRAIMREWKVGAPVWLFNPTKRVGKSPKLTIFWEETPYVIVDKVNDVVMKIQKNRKSKPRIVHVDRLKLVEGNVDTSWFSKEQPNNEARVPLIEK